MSYRKSDLQFQSDVGNVVKFSYQNIGPRGSLVLKRAITWPCSMSMTHSWRFVNIHWIQVVSLINDKYIYLGKFKLASSNCQVLSTVYRALGTIFWLGALLLSWQAHTQKKSSLQLPIWHISILLGVIKNSRGWCSTPAPRGLLVYRLL